jgi:hypothetical protein
MASTYTNRIGLEKQTDGENPNSWGSILNTNVIDLIDDAIAGYEIVSVSSTGITLSDNNGTADQSRNAVLEFAGTLTANVTITIPSEEKTYFVRENTTGSFAVKMKTAAGSALNLEKGENTFVACNGTSIYRIDSPTSVTSFTANTLNATSFSTSVLVATSITTSVLDVTQVQGAKATFTGAVSASTLNTSGNVVAAGTVNAKTYIDATNTGNITLDFATKQNFVLTLTGNITLTNPSTETVGQCGVISFIQDATGSRTVTLGTDYETAGGLGLTLSTTANAVDIVPYFVVANNRILLGIPQLAFS